MHKIGFACKLDNPPDEVNLKSTRISWFKNVPADEGYAKLYKIIEHNSNAVLVLVKHVSKLDPSLRMCRIGSDVLPLFTHAQSKEFYQSTLGKEALAILASALNEAGSLAIANNVRLSFHPGQYTVLNSINEGTVENAILEVEYHAMLAEMLGCSSWHEHGMCINIHAGSKEGGVEKLKHVISSRLSQAAKNLLTIENDEFSWGIDALIAAKLPVPIVVDIHHHWISTGEYLSATDDRWLQVADGWKGCRPKIHVAMSQEDLIVDKLELPDLATCLASQTKSTLRAHSQSAWSAPLIDNALTFLSAADLMWEGKNKDVGARQIYERAI